MAPGFSSEVRKQLLNKQYGLAGRHSAVQICSWTRKSLRGKGSCYKQKFYGVETYKCCQMSPSAAWCQQSCIFCWRPMEWMHKKFSSKEDADSPEEIIEACVKSRKKLLSGIGGAHDVNRPLFQKSFSEFPSHWAISLSGEPTLYPKLPELVKALRARKEVKTIFVVSNGQEPSMIRKLKGAGLTNLYISVDAPTPALFKKINRSIYPNGWSRLKRSLSLMKNMDCNTVIRFTLIKGLNDSPALLQKYAKLFSSAAPTYIEVKAYMFLGYSRLRLKEENMPSHEYVKEFSSKLLKFLPDYRYKDGCADSRIVLLEKKR
ncbi:MAG: 4-demethylwyosine synthase TYW1 [Candidatus ainarchaeum sp.]|nr:4-demethylwyosine synthase TYW1 [Candidatus ainarchaeum sp.]